MGIEWTSVDRLFRVCESVLMLLENIIAFALRPRGKISFLLKLKEQSTIFDVGCGNNSPFIVKQILPNCKYTGIDICDFNQTKPNLADHYVVTNADNFTEEISKFSNSFDAVISSHNIEHCDDREGTFRAILSSLKTDGKIYISFPCEDSVNFPHRRGTLNYYDKAEHKGVPPNFNKFIEELKANNFEIIFSDRRYKPPILWFVGFMVEPFSKYRKKVLRGTREYYGFESIIWARRLK